MIARLAGSRKGLTLALLGLAAMAAIRFYYAEEMLAALALFTVLFGCLEAALVVLYLVDRAGRAALDFVELRSRVALQHTLGHRTTPDQRSRA